MRVARAHTYVNVRSITAAGTARVDVVTAYSVTLNVRSKSSYCCKLQLDCHVQLVLRFHSMMPFYFLCTQNKVIGLLDLYETNNTRSDKMILYAQHTTQS